MPFMLNQLSCISPVERKVCAPDERIQSYTLSAPQLQAENRISLPQLRSAIAMRLYRLAPSAARGL